MTTRDDGWLSLRQAALKLGVSDLTIRRRIKDGRVAHRLEGGRYYVHLEGDPPGRPVREETAPPGPVGAEEAQPDRDSTSTVGGAENAVREALTTILPQYTRLAEQAGRAGVLHEQVRALEERCAALEAGTVSLAARNGWLESKLEEREGEIQLLADSQHHRPWWKRLLRSGS